MLRIQGNQQLEVDEHWVHPAAVAVVAVPVVIKLVPVLLFRAYPSVLWGSHMSPY